MNRLKSYALLCLPVVPVICLLCTTLIGYYLTKYTITRMEDVYFLFASSCAILGILVFRLVSKTTDNIIDVSKLVIVVAVSVLYLSVRNDSIPVSGWNGARAIIYQFLMLAFLLPPLVKKYTLEKKIWVLILILSAFEAILGIIQYFGVLKYDIASFKVGGTFINPSVYGSFLSIVSPLLFAGLFISNPLGNKRISKIVLLLIVVLCVTASVLSLSRTSWIAISFSMFFILFYKYKAFLYHKIFNHKQKAIFVLAVAVACLAISLVSLTMLKRDSTSGRWFIYQQSLRLAAENRFVGIGLHKFGKEYNLQQAAYFQTSQATPTEIMTADNINIATNDMLQVLVELGIAGLMLVSFLIAGLLTLSIRNINRVHKTQRIYQIGGCGAIISFSVCALLSYPMHITSLMAIALVLFCLLDFSAGKPLIRLKVTRNWSRICIAVMLVYNMIIMVNQVSQFRAEKRWIWVRRMENFEEYGELKLRYEALWPSLKNNYPFLTDYAGLAYRHGDYKLAVRLFNESKFIFSNYLVYMYLGICYQRLHQKEVAYQHFQVACNIVPNRFLPKYYLFLFYVENKDFKSAMLLRESINSLPVKIPSRQVDLIKDEVSNTILY